MSKITTTTVDLARLLGAVLPFAERAENGELAVLGALELEASGGEMAARATNRYAFGYARRPAEGTLTRAVRLGREHVDLLLDSLTTINKANRGTHLLTVDIDDERRDDSHVTVSFCGMTFQLPEWNGTFPTLTALAEALPDRETSNLSGPIALATPVLQILMEAAATFGRDVMTRWYFAGPEKPVRVEINDWFIAVLMPTKGHPNPLKEIPNVRYGLKAAAAVTS